MPTNYYYIDLNLKTRKLLEIGTAPHASHTGDASDKNVHRVFLTKGQFNKLQAKAEFVAKP